MTTALDENVESNIVKQTKNMIALPDSIKNTEVIVRVEDLKECEVHLEPIKEGKFSGKFKLKTFYGDAGKYVTIIADHLHMIKDMASQINAHIRHHNNAGDAIPKQAFVQPEAPKEEDNLIIVPPDLDSAAISVVLDENSLPPLPIDPANEENN